MRRENRHVLFSTQKCNKLFHLCIKRKKKEIVYLSSATEKQAHPCNIQKDSLIYSSSYNKYEGITNGTKQGTENLHDREIQPWFTLAFPCSSCPAF